MKLGVEFKIGGTGYDKWPEDFDPEKGTVARAVAVCPCCGASNDANTTRRLFQEGKSDQRMVAIVVYTTPDKVLGIVTFIDPNLCQK